MHALSLALALAAAPAAAPALTPVPMSAPAPSPVVRPAMLADEPAAPRGASAPVPVSADTAEAPALTPAASPTATSTSTSTATPASTPTSTSTPAATSPASTRPPPAPVPQAAVEKLGQGDRAFLASDYRNALFAYQDAVYLAPRSAAARVRLGRAYLALRYPAQATAQAEQALALDPESADAKQLLADAKTAPARPPAQPAGAGATTPAVPAVRTVIIERVPEETPANPPAGGSHVYRFTPEPETAGATATPSATAFPAPTPTAPPPTATPTPTPAAFPSPSPSDDPVALREFGAVRVGAAAEAPAARAVTPDPTGPTAGQRYRVALELLANREFERAVGELTQAIVLDPRLAVAYAARGSARFGLARYREAADDYQTALVLDERLGTPLYGLAECYRVLGEGKRAAEMYQRYADSRASDVREDLRAISAKRAQELR